MITYPQFFPNYCTMEESRPKSFGERAPALAIFLERTNDTVVGEEEEHNAPLMVNRP
jgi:hypothetical protein